MIKVPRPPEDLLAEVSPAVRAYIEALEEALEAVALAQDARIAALEARLRQDSSTSSRPPSSDPPGTQAQPRAPPASPTPSPAGVADAEPRRRRRAATPMTVTLSGTIGTETFFIRRTAQGTPVTVPLIITDGRGDWETFVGGGAQAF